MPNLTKIIASLGNLMEMEGTLVNAIKRSKVPNIEIQNMLRSSYPIQMKKTPLFQYMQNLFVEVGLGRLEIKEVKPFEFMFKIENSPIIKMFESGHKSCYITVDAIRMFFEIDMNLPSKVVETKCKNIGDEYCEFKVQMQPIAVYKAALDEKDVTILKNIIKRKKSENDEEKIRIEYLKKYKILDDSEKVTDIGKTYIKYIESIGIEKDFEKPWKKLSEVSEIIAASRSFAEAFASSSLKDIEKIDEENVINLVDEAKKSKSFAELVSKEFKEVDEE